MGLETVAHISDLVITNPTSSDPKSQGDDHLRNIKTALKTDLPNITGPMNATQVELNYAVGVTSLIQAQINAKGAIAGQAWTGAQNFTGAAIMVPTSAYGVTGSGAASLDYVLAATSAMGTAGALPWVSGATYAQYATAMSLIDLQVYRRITAAGSGATDPSADPTNWKIETSAAFPYFHAVDQKASGTNGGTSVANDITQTRTINTILANTMGASLAGDEITLQPGTYQALIPVPASGTAGGSTNKAFLYNTADSTYALVGSPEFSTSSSSRSMIVGQFKITAAKTFKIRQWTSAATANTGLGSAVATGQVEIYTDVQLWKVA